MIARVYSLPIFRAYPYRYEPTRPEAASYPHRLRYWTYETQLAALLEELPVDKVIASFADLNGIDRCTATELIEAVLDASDEAHAAECDGPSRRLNNAVDELGDTLHSLDQAIRRQETTT